MSVRKEQLAENVTLYCGDCLSLQEAWANGSVVSDPPYGIKFAKGASGKRVTGRRLTASRFIDPIVGDGVAFDPSPFLGDREVILWGSDHYHDRLPSGGRWLAWDKRAQIGPEDSFSDVEFAWHNKPGKAKVINYLWKGVCQAGEKGAPKFHIMQKPIAVMAWCIKQLHDRNGQIVDPFMGSGTTGVAAVQVGRPFVGCEIDPAYFDTACRRISDELRRPRLFAEPVAKPVQENLL
jgi:site-specific DNA-methyltransferase (adenine-specific)/modification methylase